MINFILLLLLLLLYYYYNVQQFQHLAGCPVHELLYIMRHYRASLTIMPGISPLCTNRFMADNQRSEVHEIGYQKNIGRLPPQGCNRVIW